MAGRTARRKSHHRLKLVIQPCPARPLHYNILQKYAFEQIVFLFDYDEGGYDGWKAAKDLGKDNVKQMFYHKSYESDYTPTSKNINKADSVLIEDLFPAKSYEKVIKDLQHEFSLRTTFKEIKYRNNLKGEKRIKDYLENNCDKLVFKDEWYDGFKPILDKLLELFGLD